MEKIEQTIINNLTIRYQPLISNADVIETTAKIVIDLYKEQSHKHQHLARNMVKTSLQMMNRAVDAGLYRKIAS